MLFRRLVVPSTHLTSVAALVVAGLLASAPAAAQAPLGPQATPDETRIYEAFRAWMTQQPRDVQDADDDAVYAKYATELQRQGKSAQEAAATIASLKAIGDRAEIERWNKILTAPKPSFNRKPNAFLVEMVKSLKPGRSLDVGMGQGRNTIYLAQQGWTSVGFDPADRAVAAAQAGAKAAGVAITTHVARAERFDWGTSEWDLIVLSYVGARDFAEQVTRALKPGGMVVVEAFHRDATKTHPIGGAVVFDTNELLRVFPSLRVVRYEDTVGIGDFGLEETRVVRLAAIKP
jgi:SAM-dependent methyltransferase